MCPNAANYPPGMTDEVGGDSNKVEGEPDDVSIKRITTAGFRAVEI